MVLIICTKNELNLTNRYWDMVSDRQKVRTDGRTDDAKTISLRLCRGIKTEGEAQGIQHIPTALKIIVYKSIGKYSSSQSPAMNFDR